MNPVFKQYYEVIEEFDSKKDYGIEMRKQYAECLSVLKKGEKVNPLEIARNYLNSFTKKPRKFETNKDIAYHSFGIAKKLGMLKSIPKEQENVAMPQDQFYKLETVQYFMRQHRGSRYKNIKPKNDAGTANAYGYKLWQFNNWLAGKTFEFYTQVQIGEDTFRREKKKIQIQDVEHLLKMYQEPFSAKADFLKVIKEYLLDSIHEGKRASTMNLHYCGIKSYFDKNDSPLPFKFGAKTLYRTQNGEDEVPTMSLDEFMVLLTEGNPNPTQKAAFLCKFHRGLDTATLVDRFNFQVWDQLVEYFGTENYSKWELSQCPVPIKLTRMKTDFTHIGFLDKDAIVAIQKYLDLRYKKTESQMSSGQALFLNERGEPISNNWVGISLKKLSVNAGLRKQLDGYLDTRYKINSHEVRDLLKSTLIDCGVRHDLADHFIGHKPKDSYEKQAILYPETLRSEYSKASKKLNVFSNFSSFVKGYENTEELKSQIRKLSDQQQVHIETQKAMLQVLKQKQIIP